MGIRNFFRWGGRQDQVKPQSGKSKARDLRSFLTPVQIERVRHDVKMWREAIAEAENAWTPHRVRMQRMFVDTILNGHVYALMERRKDLTLLRSFEIRDEKGKKSDVLTQQLEESEWFYEYISYSLDALFFGYTLISLGDLVDDQFPHLTIVPRWHVSPDRLTVTPFIYGTSGVSFVAEEYRDWHIWAKTPSENGQSQCGYGLFYKIGLYEIILRNTLGFNTDFVELYSQPYRVGKTMKQDEEERAQLELALQQMGSSGYAIIDETDSIEFLETALGGTGWQGYENLEKRCEEKVSKIILGHSDAVDSTPGKLGSGQGERSPNERALTDKQAKDGRFIEAITNRQLFPKLRSIGYKIPEGHRLVFRNDREEQEARQREDQNNLLTMQVAQTLKNAGFTIDPKYLAERTGLPLEKAEPINEGSQQADGEITRIKSRLAAIYR